MFTSDTPLSNAISNYLQEAVQVHHTVAEALHDVDIGKTSMDYLYDGSGRVVLHNRLVSSLDNNENLFVALRPNERSSFRSLLSSAGREGTFSFHLLPLYYSSLMLMLAFETF